MRELDRPPAADAADGAPVRLLRLRQAGWPWAVAADSVRAVVGTEQLQRNPRAAAAPCGWLLGEREELPVYLPVADATAGRRTGGAIVVLQPPGGPPCGLWVDAAEGVRETPLSRLRLLPGAVASRRWAFPRVVLWDDGLALEIAPEAVPQLAAPERPAAARRRLGGGVTLAPAAGAPRLDVPALAAAASTGLFVFTPPACGALVFALPAAQVVEVLSFPLIRPVPGAPAPLLGLSPWHGEPLPVLDLAHAVGLPAAARPATDVPRALVARAARSRQLLVLPVERIAGLRQRPFPQTAIAEPPFPGSRRVLGAFADGGQVLVVPDLDAVLQSSPEEPGAVGAGPGGR